MGVFELYEIVVMGFELMMVLIFVISVMRILWVILCCCLRNIEFKIFFVMFIMCFYILFMWEERGVLKI